MKEREEKTVKDSRVMMRTITEAQCEVIMGAVYRVLEKTGCEVRSERARSLLADAGCAVEGSIVRIPEALVKKAVSTVPKTVTLYSREGEKALELTPDSSLFGPGISCVETIDVFTGERRKADRQDAANAALICDALPNVDWASALCSVSDGNMALADVYEVYALLCNTTKPFMYWAQNMQNLKTELEMMEAVCGPDSLSKKPHGLCLTCPMDPLIENEDALEQIMYLAEKNIPQLHVAGISFGGNGPIYLAGSIVVGMADTLTGLVVSQLVRPGAPFIVGKYNDNLNMGTVTIERHNPEEILAQAATGDVFRYLGLICSANMGGDTTNGEVDLCASFDVGIQQYTALLSGTNLNIGMGGYENCTVGYLPGVVFADESVGFLKCISNGIEISEETLAEELIDELGHGGYYLTHDSTLENFRDMWRPKLFKGCARGAGTGEQPYVERAREIISSGLKHPLEPGLKAALDEIIAKAEEGYQE